MQNRSITIVLHSSIKSSTLEGDPPLPPNAAVLHKFPRFMEVRSLALETMRSCNGVGPRTRIEPPPSFPSTQPNQLFGGDASADEDDYIAASSRCAVAAGVHRHPRGVHHGQTEEPQAIDLSLDSLFCCYFRIEVLDQEVCQKPVEGHVICSEEREDRRDKLRVKTYENKKKGRSICNKNK